MPILKPKFLPLIAVAVVLAGCSVAPRGSGLQSEVLQSRTAAGQSAVDDALPQDFAVEPITRESLGRYANWPARSQGRSYGWPKGQGGKPNQIRPGDVITISVWVSEDNSLLTAPNQRVAEMPEMTVSPTGQLFLPYIGQMQVAGQSQEEARAAIEAMREPSEAMMLAWLTQQEYGDSKTLMRAKHSAMIDAALKETP